MSNIAFCGIVLHTVSNIYIDSFQYSLIIDDKTEGFISITLVQILL